VPFVRIPLMLASFALTVVRLAHRGVPIPTIAADLRCTTDDVWEAIRLLSAPLPPADVRDAIVEKMPQ